MGNQANRDAIREYMREHGVNYTTAKRALTSPADPATSGAGFAAGRGTTRVGGDHDRGGRTATLSIGVTPEGSPVGIDLRGYGHTLITGDSGCGKTNLASRIVRSALMRGDEVVVVSDKPEDYEWLPDTARTTGSSDESGTLQGAVRLLDEVVAHEMLGQRTERRLWVVVDGLVARDAQDVDEQVQDQIETAMGNIVPIARSLGVSIVVTAPPQTSPEASAPEWFGLLDNVVVMRHQRRGGEVHRCGEEAARRAHRLAKGEALLVNGMMPDGTKMTGDLPPEVMSLPEGLAFPEEGSAKCEQWHEMFREGKVVVGCDAFANDVIIDLDKTPTVLIAGLTRSGKTTLIRLLGYGALRNRDVCDVLASEGAGPGLATEITRPAHGNVATYSAAGGAEDNPTHENRRLRELADLTRQAMDAMTSRQSLLREHDAVSLSDLRRSIEKGATTDISVDEVPKRLLLLFDETEAALTPVKDPDVTAIQTKVRRDLETIAMLSRAMEVNLVMTAQQPSQSNLGNNLLANATARVVLGPAGNTTGGSAGAVFANIVRVLWAGPAEASTVRSALHAAQRGAGYLQSADPEFRDGIFQMCHLPESRLTVASD